MLFFLKGFFVNLWEKKEKMKETINYIWGLYKGDDVSIEDGCDGLKRENSDAQLVSRIDHREVWGVKSIN